MIQFPYGIADFRRIRREGMVYADRTAYIRNLETLGSIPPLASRATCSRKSPIQYMFISDDRRERMRCIPVTSRLEASPEAPSLGQTRRRGHHGEK